MEAPKNPSATEDIDNIITNKRMRAETGAKSKFSLASSLAYSAGSLETPLSQERPNLSQAYGSTELSALTGSVSLKYGINAQHSVFAGVGLRWLSPLYNSVPDGYSKFDADNPYVNYQYLYRWLGVQSALTLNETFYTNANLIRGGWVTKWSVSQNNVFDLGTSGFSLGVNIYGNVGYFNKNDIGSKMGQSDYEFGLVPALEYRVSDRVTLRTDSNLLSFQHSRATPNPHTYGQQRFAQTFAVGISVARDIYLYPGVQWLAEDIRADRTSTWISANINL